MSSPINAVAVPVHSPDSASSRLRHSTLGNASFTLTEYMKMSTTMGWEHEPEIKGIYTFGHNSNTKCTAICSTGICSPFPSNNYYEQLIQSTLKYVL
jgi:hypothetical protein